MPPTQNKLALHTWTLDTTPLAELLDIARSTGWDGVELRRLDFERVTGNGGDVSDRSGWLLLIG